MKLKSHGAPSPLTPEPQQKCLLRASLVTLQSGFPHSILCRHSLATFLLILMINSPLDGFVI